MTEEEIEQAKSCPDQVFVRILRGVYEVDVDDGDVEFNLSEGQATKLLRARYGDEAEIRALRASLALLESVLAELESKCIMVPVCASVSNQIAGMKEKSDEA